MVLDSFAPVPTKDDFQTRSAMYFVGTRVYTIGCAQACMFVKRFALVRRGLVKLFSLLCVDAQVLNVNISSAQFV